MMGNIENTWMHYLINWERNWANITTAYTIDNKQLGVTTPYMSCGLVMFL